MSPGSYNLIGVSKKRSRRSQKSNGSTEESSNETVFDFLNNLDMSSVIAAGTSTKKAGGPQQAGKGVPADPMKKRPSQTLQDIRNGVPSKSLF
jgi:hypothetical protein